MFTKLAGFVILMGMTTADSKLRWFHLTPGHLILGLLAIEGCLLLCQWLGLFPKGWTVLIAIASVGVAMLLMLLWWLASLLFRWRFQFSIRSLMVLVIAVAIPFSWLAVERERARRQREAVVALELADSGMYYAHQHEGQTPTASISCPEWLRSLLGDDFFRRVDWVNLNGTNLSESQWQHLERLATIRVLYLCDAQVGDANLIHLRGFTALEELYLERNHQLADSGLLHLQGLKQLHLLHLGGTSVTDAGLVNLQGLKQLTELNLFHTKVTNQGVNTLQQALPNCKIYR